MALRSTEEDIRDSMDVDPEGNLTPAREWANLGVNRLNTCASSKLGITLSDDELRALETLIACHFLEAKNPQYAAKSTMDASATFQGQWAQELARTSRGQDALALAKMLGVSGCLTRAVASTVWVGKTKAERDLEPDEV